MSQAVDRDFYAQAITDAAADPKKHLSLIRHYRKVGPPEADAIKPFLDDAIVRNDNNCVIEILVLAVEHHRLGSLELKGPIFFPALDYLTSKKDTRWIHRVQLLGHKAFFEELSAAETQCVLENLAALDPIGLQAERVLSYLADLHSKLVWRFFGRRIENYRAEGKMGDAFPYQFCYLGGPLSRNPQLAVDVLREWHTERDPLFRFDGARLLSRIFPNFLPEFGAALSATTAEEGTAGADFALAVIENYHAEEAIQEIARKIVDKLPDGDKRLAEVEIALQNSGAVTGKFGLVEALRERKARLVPWLADDRPKVRQFAEQFIPKLDRAIAAQQKSSEEESELWKRNFDEDENDPDSGSPPIS